MRDLDSLRQWADHMATDPKGDVTPPERALWRQIANEVGAYLAVEVVPVSDDQADLFGESGR